MWCFPVHNVFPYMKYLHWFVSRPRLVKASGDWIAYSADVRDNSAVVRKNSANFVVLISLNEATWITSRVLHLACGQETSATRNFFEIDFAREFSFVENYSKPLRFVRLLSLCCFLSASLAEKVVEQSACCYFYFTQEETDIRSCKVDRYLLCGDDYRVEGSCIATKVAWSSTNLAVFNFMV